ncbi:MAG: hypothetical protein IKN50_02070, partial [Clostridia bacterium]|nr:hypothetical protein [Clostridia bacterium]
DEKAYVVLNEDGTADIVLETAWSMLVDVSAIPEGWTASGSPVLRAVRSAAVRAGGGDGGSFSVSQSTKETVGGLMLDLSTNAPRGARRLRTPFREERISRKDRQRIRRGIRNGA